MASEVVLTRPEVLQRKPRVATHNRTVGYLLTLPAGMMLVLFFIVPVLILLPAACCEFDARMRPTWVGMANLQAIVTDQAIWNAAGVTAFFVLTTFISTMSAAFLGGMILHTLRLGRHLRVLFQLCAMLGMAANSVFWLWLFQPISGGMVRLGQMLGLPPVLWHAEVWPARLACCLVLFAWLYPADLYFVTVAASGVPKETLEAASLDGCSTWQRFWHVTVPVMRRPLTYLAITKLAGLAQVYEIPLMLWQGGPLRSTETLMMRIAAIEGGYGQAAALALVLTVISSALCAYAWRVGNGR